MTAHDHRTRAVLARRRTTRSRLAAVLLLIATAGAAQGMAGGAPAAAASMSPGDSALAGAPGPGVPEVTPEGGPVVWRVTISGSASGWSFRKTGLFYLAGRVTRVTNNDVNPLEACLKVGYPSGSPRRGSIWYGSNSDCFPSGPSRLDVAYVGISGSTVVVRPDSRYQATYVNNWTVRRSIIANIYSPISGSGRFTITSGGGLRGTIDLLGYGADPGPSRYQATLTGVRIA